MTSCGEMAVALSDLLSWILEYLFGLFRLQPQCRPRSPCRDGMDRDCRGGLEGKKVNAKDSN